MGFALEGSGGERCRVRGVILAVGVRDQLDALPGVRDFRRPQPALVHHCCNRYEMRDKRVVVAGNDDEAATMAVQMHHFASREVTLVTNDGALGLTPEAVEPGWRDGSCRW